MVININTTRFPSEISFRSDCINNCDTSHSRLNNGIRSCCSFWSSLMCSLHNTTQLSTHYTVQTTHSTRYRVCSLHKLSTLYTVQSCVVCTLYTVQSCAVCTQFRKNQKNNGVMDLTKFSKTPNAITNIFQQNESNPIALNNFSQKPANHPYTLGAIALRIFSKVLGTLESVREIGYTAHGQN